MLKKSLLVSVLFLVLSGLVQAGNLDFIKYIKMYPTKLGSNKIDVELFYRNSNGELLTWNGVPLNYECVVYHNDGTYEDPDEGSEFARKSGVLGNNFQHIVITIPSWDSDEKSPVIECTFDIGWPKLKAESAVLPK